MSSYAVVLASSVEKELKKLPGQLIARIVPRPIIVRNLSLP